MSGPHRRRTRHRDHRGRPHSGRRVRPDRLCRCPARRRVRKERRRGRRAHRCPERLLPARWPGSCAGRTSRCRSSPGPASPRASGRRPGRRPGPGPRAPRRSGPRSGPKVRLRVRAAVCRGAGCRRSAPRRNGHAAMSLSAIGVRITTGGMGRDPGMLIRMRVVSVVSVFGSSGRGGATDSGFSSEPSCDGWSDGYWRDPYGGVPEGYAAPPRPWGPEDELSVSRLKAGSPDWLRRPYFPHAAGQGTARRAHHHTGRRRRTLRDRVKPPPAHHTCGGLCGPVLGTSRTGPAAADG